MEQIEEKSHLPSSSLQLKSSAAVGQKTAVRSQPWKEHWKPKAQTESGHYRFKGNHDDDDDDDINTQGN